MKVGLLALQGAFARHGEVLDGLGIAAVEVKTPAQLDDVDALIMPGGESTTMSMLLASSGLFDAIDGRLDSGMPVLGTCAGMILLAAEVLDGRADQRTFAAIDLTVRRNGYGRQVESFEADLDIGDERPFPAVFIRAPFVERVGDEVEVLARIDGAAVLCRQSSVMVAAFHPELSPDSRIHQRFLELAGG